ncbi:MAG: penicillin acylase family protein, partial [Saprospiraceae bacterium]|nr:penicillin acylase family protein [Saprospiraceae bacterium]
KVTGPSWRMIVEMGPEIKAYGVFPGGQSGNPGSPFYDNMLDEWEEGKYFELQFMASPSDTRQRVLRRERFIK